MKKHIRSRVGMLVACLLLVVGAHSVFAGGPKEGSGGDKSDLNADGVVDILDLQLFSSNYLERDVALVDWCAFYDATKAGEDFEGLSTRYYEKNFKMLLAFIYEDFDCGVSEPPPPPPGPAPEPKYLVRVARATDGSGDYYFTDARTHSVFVYGADLQPKREIKGLASPLGIAVDSIGNLLVGNDGRDNVEVFEPATGNMVGLFAGGLVKMPTAITVGPDGLIYVTDSQKHRVWVFDAEYTLLRAIGSGGLGAGELDFPVDTLVLTYEDAGQQVQEIFVADQGNSRVQIYDHAGEYLRTIKSGCGSFSCKPPEFRRIQALAADSQGRLHVLDNFKALVSIMDPETGMFITSYGEYGEEAGFLRVPLDLVINEVDEAVITAGDGARLEKMPIP